MLLDIPEPIVKVIVEATKGCAQNMDLSELLAMVREGRWNDKPEYKKMISCSFMASGFATSDGKVIVEKALLLFAGKEDARKVIIECAKSEGPTPEESLYNFYKCFQLKSPYTINLYN